MILVITNKDDAHITPVAEHLNNNGQSFFRLNSEAFLTDYDITWLSSNNSTDFEIHNRINNLTIKGSEINSVWERRPEAVSEVYSNSGKELNELALKEATGFIQWLQYYLIDKFWLGHALYDRLADSKLLQLKVAKEVGFITPQTILSNNGNDIKKFAECNPILAIKAINSYNVTVNDADYLFYTQKISNSDLQQVNDEGFKQTINFFQAYIEKQFELRVTMVGNKAFACKIDSQLLNDDTGKHDWRQGIDDKLTFEPFSLPIDVERQCFEYLQKLNLNFGAFDFIVTPQNEYVFVECNPNGQWLWIEIETGLKISEHIANTLIQGKL